MAYKLSRTKRKESAQKERPASDLRPIMPYRESWRERWRREIWKE